VGGGREAQEGGDVWLIHIDVWQKPTQYYKATILQLKRNYKKEYCSVLYFIIHSQQFQDNYTTITFDNMTTKLVNVLFVWRKFTFSLWYNPPTGITVKLLCFIYFEIIFLDSIMSPT